MAMKPCLWAAFFIIFGAFANISNAQSISESCDANIYESMTAKSYLEAQRQLIEAENVINKPDSVLEYSCLQALTDPKSKSPDDQSGLSYLDNNYSHSILGGTVPDSQDKITGYNDCKLMSYIWDQARCVNFNDDETNNHFLTFAEYRDSDDRRTLPNGKTCEPQDGITWADAIAVASLPPAIKLPDVKTTQAQLKDIFKSDCSKSPMIPTGRKASRVISSSQYKETDIYICGAANCYFNVDSGACEPG